MFSEHYVNKTEHLEDYPERMFLYQHFCNKLLGFSDIPVFIYTHE